MTTRSHHPPHRCKACGGTEPRATFARSATGRRDSLCARCVIAQGVRGGAGDQSKRRYYAAMIETLRPALDELKAKGEIR